MSLGTLDRANKKVTATIQSDDYSRGGIEVIFSKLPAIVGGTIYPGSKLTYTIEVLKARKVVGVKLAVQNGQTATAKSTTSAPANRAYAAATPLPVAANATPAVSDFTGPTIIEATTLSKAIDVGPLNNTNEIYILPVLDPEIATGKKFTFRIRPRSAGGGTPNLGTVGSINATPTAADTIGKFTAANDDVNYLDVIIELVDDSPHPNKYWAKKDFWLDPEATAPR